MGASGERVYLPQRSRLCQGDVDVARGVRYGAWRMRLLMRIVNVLIALVTLASALAVLFSDLTVVGYRACYQDALWFVVLYVVVQAVMLVAFARDHRLVPWLALGKAAVAWAFLADFSQLWPTWYTWTPARYVYLLFEWNTGTKVGLFAFVFLGRGAFNTLNATYFTAPWWRELRVRRPLLGRAVTALPMALIVLFLWTFFALQQEEVRTTSAEAQEVARDVNQNLACDTVREHVGTTTTDIRQRGAHRYLVQIAYACAATRILVRAEDGRIGSVAAPQLECFPLGP